MSNHVCIDLSTIQEVVATASPSLWHDGLVASHERGVMTVVLLDGEIRALASRAICSPGDPVALHLVAEVVAVGAAWYSARLRGS